MLLNGGIEVKGYAVEHDTILFTEDNGKSLEFQQFILDQPEALAVRLDNQDKYPPGKRGEKAKALLEERKKAKEAKKAPPKTINKKKKKKKKKKSKSKKEL